MRGEQVWDDRAKSQGVCSIGMCYGTGDSAFGEMYSLKISGIASSSFGMLTVEMLHQ